MFRFRQFTIHHDRCAMKVGTDGVLLGAWADVAQARRVLDIGCGSALIALMLAQRNAEARVVGVEIDPDSARQAQQNVAESPWAGRVEVVQADIARYAAAEPFDLIVSNPPYFEEALLPPDAQRAAARHTAGLSFAALARHARRLLAPMGRFEVVIPTTAQDSFLTECLACGLFLRRAVRVVTKAGKAPKRLLLSLAQSEGPVSSGELVLTAADGSRSPQYRALTAEFYL